MSSWIAGFFAGFIFGIVFVVSSLMRLWNDDD